MGRAKQQKKNALEHALNAQIQIIMHICSLIQVFVLNLNILLQKMILCADGEGPGQPARQADLGRRCLHISKDTFSPSAAHTMVTLKLSLL